jgi:hypothetical protein
LALQDEVSNFGALAFLPRLPQTWSKNFELKFRPSPRLSDVGSRNAHDAAPGNRADHIKLTSEPIEMKKEIDSVQTQVENTPARVRELTEQELLVVAGGRAADSHVHMSCCNDCPTRDA